MFFLKIYLWMFVWAMLQWTWRGTFEAILYTRNAESIIFKINFHNNFDPLCSEWITYGHASLPSDLEWIELHRPTGWKRKSLLHMWFDLILFSSLNKIHCIKHLTSVRRAPVRSSLANRGAKPSRQARETVHLSKMKKKIKNIVQDASYTSVAEIAQWNIQNILGQ